MVESAINKYMALYHKQLVYFANYYVGDLAEDCVADVFIKLINMPDTYVIDEVRHFLWTSVRNKCLNVLTHLERKNKHHKAIAYTGEKADEELEARMIKAQLVERIIKIAEDHLPPVRKEIFFLYYRYGLSRFEIAKKLNISADTVRVQHKRALDFIKNYKSEPIKKQLNTCTKGHLLNEANSYLDRNGRTWICRICISITGKKRRNNKKIGITRSMIRATNTVTGVTEDFPTHCIHGHELTPENSIINSKTGRPRCKSCYKVSEKKQTANRKAKIAV